MALMGSTGGGWREVRRKSWGGWQDSPGVGGGSRGLRGACGPSGPGGA